ncbi:MAG: hypothetical protein Hyperionvirus2_54 [Hyperionvirus sp.]|uniref:Sel1 repeat family protein n=1 Tax=Hyperionvirus sp. TaxID=2487770 RepID=A0A3G5A615_9VIRU|nr:MAG: hypothetical protein Hyperionvirus2_54 [Hyperionvirus sp.]
MTLRDVREIVSKRIGTGDVSCAEDRKDRIKDRLLKLSGGDRKDLFDWLLGVSVDPCVKNLIGLCYGDGIGVEKNSEKSFEWVEAAAIGGNHWGYYNMAHQLINSGKDKTIDARDRIVIALKKSIELKNDDAMTTLGGIYRKEMNVREAIVMYKRAAECGNPAAMVALGSIYWYDNDHKDSKEAIVWTEKAISAGDVGSMYFMGVMLHYLEEYGEAIRWLNKSVFCGNLKALTLLGLSYQGLNNGVKAIEIFKRGLEAGESDSMVYLGELYLKQGNVGEDVVVDLFKRADCKKGYYDLANLYERKGDRINSAKYYLLSYSKGGVGKGMRELRKLYRELSEEDYIEFVSHYAKIDGLEKENLLLKEEVNRLKDELMYRPGGVGELAARENFNEKIMNVLNHGVTH